jgi:hypothetical protein
MADRSRGKVAISWKSGNEESAVTKDAPQNEVSVTASRAQRPARRHRDVDDTLLEPLHDWDTLTATTTTPDLFAPAMLTDLPEPVRRWLTHAIAPGTPLRRAAVFHQYGQIKIGRWQRYTADWVLAPPHGFVWAATTRLGPLSIRGFDRYTHGIGEMRWRLWGRIPFISAHGPDVTRSAIGRLAGEFCFVPAAALAPDVRWEALDDHRAVANIDIGGRTNQVTITVNDTGSLDRVDVPRWGQPDRKTFGEHLFTALLNGPEATFDGYTIAATARAGWWHCPDHCATQEFIRFTVDHASYR